MLTREESSRRYYLKNREKILARERSYRVRFPEKMKERDRKKWIKFKVKSTEKRKKWYGINKDNVLNYNKEYYKKHKKQIIKNNKLYYHRVGKYNIKVKIKMGVSCLIRASLKRRLSGKNGKRTFSFLPYTIDGLIQHLEDKFQTGMSWGNYGRWHIDQIIPDCSFDYKSIEDSAFQKCWELKNLQPLWAEDNLKKNRKINFAIRPNQIAPTKPTP